MKNIFICYESTTGQGYAEHLKKSLEKSSNNQYDVFLADVTLIGGDKWRKEIDDALKNCEFFLVVITALTMNSVEVLKEYDIAVKLNKKIIPLRYSGIKVEDTYEISHIQQITFSEKYELANKVLIELNKIEHQQLIIIEKESNENFRRGNLLYNFQMFNDALFMYQKVVKQNHNFPGAWANISKIHSIFKRYDNALNSIDIALELNPEFIDAWIDRGMILIDLEKYPEALLSFENAIKLNPNSIDARRATGALLGKLNKFNEALKAINKVLFLDKNDYQTWVLRGYTNCKIKKLNDAESDYNKAISIKPDFADAWYYLACLYSKRKDKEKAIEYLKKAISLNAEFRSSFIEDEDFNNFLTEADLN